MTSSLNIPHARNCAHGLIWGSLVSRSSSGQSRAFTAFIKHRTHPGRDSYQSRSKTTATAAAPSSRRAGSDAERSRRSLGKKHTGNAEPHHEHDVKIVTAYCAAEQYRISEAAQILRTVGYRLDPASTRLFPQVLHIQSANTISESGDGNLGDIFIFPSGTIVAWDVKQATVMSIVSRALLAAAEKPTPTNVETEDLQFEESSRSHKSRIHGDKIELGTKINPELTANDLNAHGDEAHSIENQRLRQHETNLALAKIAFSSGLARSVKLAVLENELEAYFESTKSIPDLMAKGSKIPFSRKVIIRKTGELLKLRAQLNLNSELTDALPDMFWDSRYELGLEGYFDQVGRALDITSRSRILNQRMDYAADIVSVLREQLSERHGLTLEWLIIGLIAIEVLFEIHNVVREF